MDIRKVTANIGADVHGVDLSQPLDKGVVAEIIPVHGSVELAPLVGLSHLIVDIVETGATLRENRLEVLETVTEVSTQLIANRASYKLRSDVVRPLIERLRAATASAGR